MFAVQCSFCQHENTPGARFCAECGSPLHLRVCPNPKCGKVSDVNAAQCEFCGTPFPKIPLAEAGGGAATPPSSDRDQVEPLGEDKPGTAEKSPTAAWPLIAVAIVAGGLPLLWFNRASLPTPRTWQNSPEVERLIAPPVLPPAVTPAASPTASPPPQGAESLTLPPLSAPIQPPAAEKSESVAAENNTQPATAEAKPPRQEKPKARRDAGDNSRPAEPAEAQPTCSDATAAPGPCEATPVRK